MKKRTEPIVRKQPTLANFVTIVKWLDANRGGSSLDTPDKLSWFIRQHRPELIARGEYVPGIGARPSLLGPGFDALALEILRRAG